MATSTPAAPDHHHPQLSPVPLRWVACGPLGSGSFGHVSLGLNLQDHSVFAIKSCPASSPLLPSLLNEFRLLQSLDSPFIVRCLGGANIMPAAVHAAHPPSIFLEYMDAGSLADLHRRSDAKLSSESFAARCAKAILQGLQHLHQSGIVHCDIKGHNILMDSTGAIKIADLGAARRIGENCSPKTLRGTPLYMAPEVVLGEDQGPPSDIWSLGCTVVELLQGCPPWARIKSIEALFLKLGSSQESVPLPEMVSAEAKDFLQQCFRRDPKQRPTASELLQHPFLRSCSNTSRHTLENDRRQHEERAHSPTSTLDFPNPEARSESGWESDACAADNRNASSSSHSGSDWESSIGRHKPQNGVMPTADGWITVKRTSSEAASDGSPPPQAQDGRASVRTASEVSFESAAFLRNRNRVRSSKRSTVG